MVLPFCNDHQFIDVSRYGNLWWSQWQWGWCSV